MKKFKNLALFFIIYIFLAFSFFGCAVEKEAQGPSLTIWHWMTDRHDVFLGLAQMYEDNTGVRVNFELYAPSDAYTQKVRGAAQARTLPDIYGILGEKRDFAAFIKSGYVADLTSAMEENNAMARGQGLVDFGRGHFGSHFNHRSTEGV